MKTGDQVFVFPKADVRRGVAARVVIASENGNSLILSLGESTPPFAHSLTIHPSFGIVLVLLREETTAPFWKDIFAGNDYGISIPGRAENLS